jgi:hypothetical protein
MQIGRLLPVHFKRKDAKIPVREKNSKQPKNLGQRQTERVNYASLMLIDVGISQLLYIYSILTTLRGIYLHINTSFPAIHTISAISSCLEYLIMFFVHNTFREKAVCF